jgi:hypothetical protein
MSPKTVAEWRKRATTKIFALGRHSRESGNPGNRYIPALRYASAGMTELADCRT